VVVCSELPTDEGASVTNIAEQLAAEVIRYHRFATPVGVDRVPPAHKHGRGHRDLRRGHLLELRGYRKVNVPRGDTLDGGGGDGKRIAKGRVEVLVGGEL